MKEVNLILAIVIVLFVFYLVSSRLNMNAFAPKRKLRFQNEPQGAQTQASADVSP